MIEKTVSQRRYENEKTFVVTCNCTVLGAWRNLKKLCEDMKEKDEEFLSYSSLSKRRNDENPMKFSTSAGEYSVYIEKLR